MFQRVKRPVRLSEREELDFRPDGNLSRQEVAVVLARADWFLPARAIEQVRFHPYSNAGSGEDTSRNCGSVIAVTEILRLGR